MNQLGNALESAGFTTEQVTKLWQRGDLKQLLLWLNGSTAITVVRHLSSSVAVMVTGSKRNLKEFYQTRTGLWLFENFKKLILADLPEGEVASAESRLVRADLEQEANDGEIDSELPKGNVFKNRDHFLCYLATLIEDQWGGKDGELLSNSFANIFHVQIGKVPFSVNVYWGRDASEWFCYAGPLDAVRWDAGRRVFGATAPKKL